MKKLFILKCIQFVCLFTMTTRDQRLENFTSYLFSRIFIRHIVLLTFTGILCHLSDQKYGTLLLLELIYAIKKNKFTATESNEISSFLERALVRLEAWFQWFNTTQSGTSRFLFNLLQLYLEYMSRLHTCVCVCVFFQKDRDLHICCCFSSLNMVVTAL